MLGIKRMLSRTPEPLKRMLRPIRDIFLKKNANALSFWRSRLKKDSGVFDNSHYEKLMLGMAGEPSDNFLEGKIVADFGCGPRGSLVWAKTAAMRMGIDVLADRYADEFTSNIISHGMVYLKCTENVIPLPSEYIDVLFTLNAIDHVDNFSKMCAEIVRVLKAGGEFIGSFNLEEPPSLGEPQRLNEKIIKESLLDHMEVMSYRVTRDGPPEDLYAPFFEGTLSYEVGEQGILWVRARKPV